jgi:hypothetical protein
MIPEQVDGVEFALGGAHAAADAHVRVHDEAPQPRQRAVSFFTCSSVKVTRTSLKVRWPSSAFARPVPGGLSKRHRVTGMTAFFLSSAT